MEYEIRKATFDDYSAIEKLISISVRELSTQDYTIDQIEGALRGVFGVDTQLIKDGTYFVAESENMVVGCGGWSKRKTLFGGDKHIVRDSGELDPNIEPAKIRAFFVHPQWVRKGIAKTILANCESEALLKGFRSLELMATLPGVRFYSVFGFIAGERINYTLTADLSIEFVSMKKILKK